MRTKLPSKGMPDGCIYLTITDYNLSGRKGKSLLDLSKTCPNCSRRFSLLEFLVIEKRRIINGKEYATLEEDRNRNWCRDCHPAHTQFYLFRNAGGKLKMRIWELRYSSDQPVLLFDPTSKSSIPRERLRKRGIRLMDGTVDQLALQPQSDRSVSLKTGEPRKRAKPATSSSNGPKTDSAEDL